MFLLRGNLESDLRLTFSVPGWREAIATLLDRILEKDSQNDIEKSGEAEINERQTTA